MGLESGAREGSAALAVRELRDQLLGGERLLAGHLKKLESIHVFEGGETLGKRGHCGGSLTGFRYVSLPDQVGGWLRAAQRPSTPSLAQKATRLAPHWFCSLVCVSAAGCWGRRRCLLGHVDSDLGSVVIEVSIEPVTSLCLSFLSHGRDRSLTRGLPQGLLMRMNENRKSTRVLMLETPGRLAENAGAPPCPWPILSEPQAAPYLETQGATA